MLGHQGGDYFANNRYSGSDKIECLQRSDLLRHINRSLLSSVHRFRRPKIAIIDTGYDQEARCMNHQLRKRLSPSYAPDHLNYHWKDFWTEGGPPRDDDGHGTSMLSVVSGIAPFADIFVARIARTSQDLKELPSKTSENLAAVSIQTKRKNWY
jgi:hypothetical protein